MLGSLSGVSSRIRGDGETACCGLTAKLLCLDPNVFSFSDVRVASILSFSTLCWWPPNSVI